MNLDNIRIGWLTLMIICTVLISIEVGYRLGHIFKKYGRLEKESPVSVISGSILGLLAFLLAFTFGIVYQRFETRKDTVRNEAGLIRSAITFSDFMSEPYREKTVRLLKELIDIRVGIVQNMDTADVKKTMNETKRIHAQLWNLAVINVRQNISSNIAALNLYIASLKDMIDIQLRRATLVLQDRLPFWILMALYLLLVFAMVSIGYHIAISGSSRSIASILLALSFSLVLAIIISLDRPGSFSFKVSQQPLIDLKNSIATDSVATAYPLEKH
jgi:hypothetical protein